MEMVQNLIRNLSAAEKLQFYSYHTKPVLNFQALFTDGSSNYMNPVEPKTGDEVTVRFRTARENAEHVFLCVNGEKKEMQIASKTERFDFYESSFFMGTEIADYYFEIHSGKQKVKNKDSKSVRESAIKIFIFMNTFGIVSFGDIAHKVYLENLLLRIEI